MNVTNPDNENRPHIESADCWCNPSVEYVPGKSKPVLANETVGEEQRARTT